jgi:hypothetical protein
MIGNDCVILNLFLDAVARHFHCGQREKPAKFTVNFPTNGDFGSCAFKQIIKPDWCYLCAFWLRLERWIQV